jgi:hypothetical protein
MSRWAWGVGAHRVSAIKDDVVVCAAVWAPHRAAHVEYSVRGVPVAPTERTHVDQQGRSYRWCVFPDYRVMLVNEGNIRERKVGKYDAVAKAKSGSN